LDVLGSMDWSAVGPEFKISIAAVRGDIDEVVSWMRRIGANDDLVNAQSYQEWPVFYGVRGEEKFTKAFKQIFGLEYVPAAKEQAGLSQVINWAKRAAESDDGLEDERPNLLDAPNSKSRTLN